MFEEDEVQSVSVTRLRSLGGNIDSILQFQVSIDYIVLVYFIGEIFEYLLFAVIIN
jgi:hypothetical protein